MNHVQFLDKQHTELLEQKSCEHIYGYYEELEALVIRAEHKNTNDPSIYYFGYCPECGIKLRDKKGWGYDAFY